MKTLFIIFQLILITKVLSGQSIKIDSCGIDTDSKLNVWEEIYLKKEIKELKNIDLQDKKFAFAYGNFGKTIINKKDYFEKWGRNYYNASNGIFHLLLKLTEEEKQNSGGYDFIIISWSKVLPAGKSRAKLIERVRNYSEGNFINKQ